MDQPSFFHDGGNYIQAELDTQSEERRSRVTIDFPKPAFLTDGNLLNVLSKMVAMSHIWLLSTWNVVSMIEGWIFNCD